MPADQTPARSGSEVEMPHIDTVRAQDCQRVYAYAVVSGAIKLVLGHPVLGAVGIDWALTREQAAKLRDDLDKALA